MKKFFSLLNISLASFTVLLIIGGWTLRTSINKTQPLEDPLTSTPVEPSRTQASFEKFGLNQPQDVDLVYNTESLARLSPREQNEQVLDWLLLTLTANSGLTKDAINKVTFDQPSIRYGYLASTTRFQFGEIRSLYIGNGQVIALIPADSQEDLRIDQLARIADDQRKATGGIPETFLVFEYTLSPDLYDATITRRIDVLGANLFTEASGYYEMQVSSQEDLEEFMAKIDDVTTASIENGDLYLGGRKLKSSHYQNISVEDVAALWQANQAIRSQWDRFNDKWQQRINAYNTRCAGSFSLYDYYGFQLTPRAPSAISGVWSTAGMTCSEEKKAIEDGQVSEYLELREQNQLINGTGFSLDPTYDFMGIKGIFQEYPDLVSRVIASGVVASEDVYAAINSLDNQDILPMLQLTDALSRSSDQDMVDIGVSLDYYIRYQYTFNQARYDGNLQGTNAGMILFYTDLLAKLWALNFKNTAPINEIKEFSPIPQSSVSLVYESEIKRLKNTRLWFGPAKEGFQLAGSKNNLLLGRKSTRVYAASSNPLQPGVEETPNEAAFAFLNWWDTHYDEIANFEPQYQRLNEIMKWSLIISWLGDSDNKNALSYLDGKAVTNTYWFPDWVTEHPELKFSQWENVTVYPQGSFGTQTEVIPTLTSDSYIRFGDSWVLSGGVSLADLDAFADLKPLIPSIENDLLLRAGLDLEVGISEDSLMTLEKTQVKFLEDTPFESSLIATPDEQVLLRNIDSDIRIAPMERTIKISDLESSVNTALSETRSLVIETKIGTEELGNLSIHSKANGFEVGWVGRDIDNGQIIAIDMSKTINPLSVIQKNPNVHSVFELPGDEVFLVHLKNSTKWMKTGVTEASSIESPWLSHVSDPIEGVQVIGTDWVDTPASIFDTIQPGGELRFSASQEGVLTIGLHEAPGSARTVEIKLGDTTITGRFDAESGDLFISSNELPEEVLQSPARLENLITANDLTALKSRTLLATDEPLAIISSEEQLKSIADFGSQYKAKNFNDLARQFAADPAASSKIIAEHMRQELNYADHLMASEEWAQANGILHDLLAIHGDLPEIQLRQSIIQLEQGRVNKAVQTLNQGIRSQSLNTGKFYDEINGLLRSVDYEPNAIRAMQSQEWELLQGLGSLPDDGKVITFNSGQQLGLEYHFSGDVSGTVVGQGSDFAANKLVYVQDSPGLNNLDWGGSVDQSLQTIVTQDLGTISILPRGDISHFIPDRFFTENGLQFNNVTRFTNVINLTELPTPLHIYTPYPCSNDDLQDTSCHSADPIVYIVTMKP